MNFLDFAKKHPTNWMHEHLKSVFTDLSTDTLEVRIQEFLKFIYLFSTQGGGFIPVSDEIDDIWHEYILQTMMYQEICEDTPPGKFIHHQTISLEEYSQTRDPKAVVKSLLDWIPNYIKAFGPFTEESAPYWTAVQFIMNELHLPLEEINKITN